MSDETEISPPEDTTEEALSPLEPMAPEPKKPVLTIHVYSWATPILGIVMLLLGLFAGYFARPLLQPSAASPTKAAQATSAPQQNQAGGNPSLKDVVVAQTRHFIGDPNAPVTIVEFSDYQ